MELYHEIKEHAYVMILSGNLDGDNASEIAICLKKALKSEKEKILVDCHQLEHISSKVIGNFLTNLPTVKEQGKELIFCGLNPRVNKVFQVLGLNHLVTLTDAQL